MVRTALRAAEEGVYCWNLESGHINYTEQCLRMMGLPYRELAPNVFTQPEITIHEKDVQFFKNGVTRYIDRPCSTPLRLEIRLRNQRSRGWKWVRINGLVKRDNNNKPLQLVGVWIDITRRKMANMHAMEDRELFRALIDYLPDNIYFKNRESRFVIANNATAKKLGVVIPSDLIGKTDKNFFTEDDFNVSRSAELEIMRSGQPLTSFIHRESREGLPDTWSQISKFPWFGADGKVKGIVGISSDVSDIVRSQHRYQRIAKHLDERNKALENEVSLAREVQLALQPLKIRPRVKHLDSGIKREARFHHIFMPSEGVAGDCFQVFPVGESGVGMLICDVMGHGISAALIASMLRGLMEQVVDLADTPALLLSSLNRKLYHIFEQAGIHMFATACYVYLDLERARLTLSGAGHPSPIVIDAEGKAYLPPIPRSPGLGLMETSLYRESELSVSAGMKLSLYTDGLIEAHNSKDEELGAIRILDHLNSNPPEGIKEMIDSCIKCMQNFTGSLKGDDDICMLGMEFTETFTLNQSTK